MDVQALGQYLRETREAKELSLDDAELALRIRRRILESFESGDFNLPDFSPVQIRGFIRNYARYLGLEEDRVIQLYETALVETSRRGMGRGRKAQRARENGKRSTGETPTARNGSAQRSTGEYTPIVVEPQRGRLGVILGVLLRLIVAAASLAVIALVAFQLIQPPPLAVEPTATISGVLGDLPPTATFTPEPTNIVVALPTSASLPNIDGVLVTLQLNQRTWMRLSVDGVDQFIGMARPGSTLEYRANDRIELTASNAQALAVTLNGQRQPSLGMRGQQVTAVFERTGMQILSSANFEPTPTTSPTPLPTPTDSALIEQLTQETAVDPLLVPPATADPLFAPPDTDPSAADPLLAEPTTDPALIAPTEVQFGGASDEVLPTATLAAADLLSMAIPTATPQGNIEPPAVQDSFQTTTSGQLPPPTALPLPGMPTQPPPTQVVEPVSASIVPTIEPTVEPPTFAPTATIPPTEPPTETPTFTPSYTLPPSMTPTTPPSRTPTPTFTPTITLTPTNTAILPPRATPVNATPTKTGA